MAERPVFIPMTTGPALVKEISFSFPWHPGFAPVQKKKNVQALHDAARTTRGYEPLLEVSTKSDEPLGQHLSAFSLKVHTDEYGGIPLECAFQGSLSAAGRIPTSTPSIAVLRREIRDCEAQAV